MQEFFRKYKFLFVIIILAVVGLIIFLKRERFVIIDGVNGVFTYNGKWNYNKDFNKHDSKKFYVYSNNQLLGQYKLKYGSGWIIYDSEKIIPYDYDIVAFNNNQFKVVPYEKVNNYDDVVINFMDSKNIYDNNYYYSAYEYDFDGDSFDEQLILLSNFSMQNEDSRMFSYVFINDEGKVIPVKQSVSNDLTKIQLYSLSSIFTYDGKIHFIINTDYFSQPDKTCQELFEYNNGINKLYKCK